MSQKTSKEYFASLPEEEKRRRSLRSRGKGKRGERLVCSLLRQSGFKARRGSQSQALSEEPDVISDFPFRIEVKNLERPNILKSIRQVNSDNKTKIPSCIIFKYGRASWWAAVPAQELIKLCAITREKQL